MLIPNEPGQRFSQLAAGQRELIAGKGSMYKSAVCLCNGIAAGKESKTHFN